MIQRIADGRTDLVIDHLAEGHAADVRDANGTPLIRWCAYYGDVTAVRHLLAHGESLETLGINYDLNGAAFHGHWRLVQFLVERGADVNHPLSDTGETPLHAALGKAQRASTGHVVRVLLAAGAEPNVVTRVGVPTGAFMRDARTRAETPLHRAAAFCDAEVIRQLLDAGARADARDASGDSPLAWASWHLRPPEVLALLCFGDHRVPRAGVGRASGDHGAGGPSVLDLALLGTPHV